VVACAGRRLAVVPESPAPGGAVDFTEWPVQPVKLCLVAGRGGQPAVVVIVGEDGSACALAVADGRLPPPPADLAPPKPGTATACLGACVNGGYVTVVRQLPSGRKAGSSSSSSSSSSAAGSGSGGECAVFTWAVPQVTVDGAARPLADAAAVRSDFPLQGSGAGEGRERVVAVCAHDGARAVSVVLAGPAKAPGSHGRWLKFDCTDGRLLFERTLNPTTDTIIASAASSSSSSSSSSSQHMHVNAAGGLLWVVRGGVATAWDPRYGVPVHTAPLPAAARSPLFALVAAETEAPLAHPAPGPGPRAYHYHLVVCVQVGGTRARPDAQIFWTDPLSLCIGVLQAAGGVTVLRGPLALPAAADQPLGALSHAIGRLAPPPPAPPASGDARKRAGSADGPAAAGAGVLGTLPEAARTVVENAAAAQAAADAAGKRYKGAAALPAAACAAFVAALAAAPEGAASAGDWAAARAVLAGGAVGLGRRSPLPRRAAAAGRFDVLQVRLVCVNERSLNRAVPRCNGGVVLRCAV